MWMDEVEEKFRDCHSLCGSVDWNEESMEHLQRSSRHSLCGSVDWNRYRLNRYILSSCVTPFVGVWIEITPSIILALHPSSHSLCGSVDWNYFENKHTRAMPSLPLWECGLKYQIALIAAVQSSHSLCGSVDWNLEIRLHRNRVKQSLPLWECGLKCSIPGIECTGIASLPLWECGLKC